MKRNLLAIIILVSLISNTRSQTIQGFVTDTSSVGVYGVSVQAILQNDTTKRKATITDFSGYYELKDITTGINDIPGFSGNKMTIAYNGSQMEISVISNKFHIINA
ncbi:MAG: carboxypeptidase-like regulatory domain-containing protein, partial [Perlabentimonas sp.]